MTELQRKSRASYAVISSIEVQAGSEMLGKLGIASF